MSEKPKTVMKLDLHALDAVLNAFVSATQDHTASRNEVYEAFHRRMIAATDSLAAAVFSKRPESQFTMISQAGWRELGSSVLADVKQTIKRGYAQNYSQRIRSSDSSRVSTFVGRSAPVNGVKFLYVLVRRKESDPLVDELLGDLTHEITSQIETYEIKRTAGQKPKAVNDLTHLVQLAQNVGGAVNLTQLAMHLVNDLAKTTGADRVCFFSPQGKLLAVSGVSTISLKTSLAKSLSRIARFAHRSGAPVESAEDQLTMNNARRQKSVRQWLSELDADIVYVTPILNGKHSSGVVSLEYFQAESLEREWTDQRNLIAQSLSFIAPVVDRAVQVNSIPGIRLLDFFFNRILVQPIRMLLWTLAIFTLITVTSYFLFFVKRPFEITADGVLQPTVKRNVFSPSDGEIKSLWVAEGSVVESGQSLAVIESKALADQRIIVDGELAESLQQLQNLAVADSQFERTGNDEAIDQQTQTAAEIERLKSKVETLQARLALLDQQESKLHLVAPIRGQVTTPDLDHRLDSRPVNRGDLLMSISELDGEWEIELQVLDNRVEFIRSATDPQFRFRLATDSESVYQGQLREFDFRVVPAAEGALTYAKALVDFNETELGANLRLGSRVIAKIDCGEKSNWYLLTYELKQKLKEWFFW